MAYHPRIESRKIASLFTTRSRNSELWLVNNRSLEKDILGYAAKYAQRYCVKLYALAIEGNHIHGPAVFPKGNRAHFMRDFNSSVARAVPRRIFQYRGGRFWARRYSSEFLPGAEDIEEYFFYTVLQAVNDGLVEKISDYPGYNCFHDAIYGIKRKLKIVRWGAYHAAKRNNPHVSIKDFTLNVTLQYERLPGYGGLPQQDYAKLMLKKLEEKRLAIVNDRLSKGLGFVGRTRLLNVLPGATPKVSKTSTIYSHRPRILSISPQRRAKFKAWYFRVYFEYKEASKRYRSGELDVAFPKGTYRPYCAYHPPSNTKARLPFRETNRRTPA